MHGKVDRIGHSGGTLFKDVDAEFSAVRYHSLVVECDDQDLTVCARSRTDREVMAIEHREARLYGLQFHPESYATPDGMQFIRNFLEVCNGNHGKAA